MLRVHDVGYPVTGLGPGRRIGIWFQGCSLGCRGCMSPETWAADDGRAVSADDVVRWCQTVQRGGVVDGVTISGGEPFEQPAALAELLEALCRWRRTLALDVDLLCYSGLPLARLRRDHGDVLALLDAVIPEPFVVGRPDGGRWRGSDNQPVVPLSELGRVRYRSDEDADAPVLQVSAVDGAVRIVGVPRRGDLAALTRTASARGVALEAEASG